VTRRIAIFTGSRADWGLLSMPARRLAARADMAVTIIATGQHSGPEGTAATIEHDGFDNITLIDMQLTGDTRAELSHSMAQLQHGLTTHLSKLRPDLLVLLGDRYEILTAATVATMMALPIAHIAGGDLTEGAMDDAIRHAVTKLSHLHFVTNADARHRLLSMGEQPERVILSGSPGIDRLLQEPQISRAGFFEQIRLRSARHNVVATFHPVTLATDEMAQLDAMLKALATFGDDIGIIFTGVNADPGFRAVDDAIARFCSGRLNTVRHASLGPNLYANALRHCDAVIGNSSSGLYEAPTFETPALNIGDRQNGRLRAASVVDCPGHPAAIAHALRQAFAMDCTGVRNPYGDGNATAIICDTIVGIADVRSLLRKRFYEVGPQ
jgi:UDP-hydrolysing UDP-N-acetyl-D-glucosamine 2-epimerase